MIFNQSEFSVKLTKIRLQFMSAGLSQCAVPTSIHCDHLIQAVDGADSDLKVRTDSMITFLRLTQCFPAFHCYQPRGL